MKTITAFILGLAYASAYQNLDSMINEINSKQDLWIAGKNFHDTPISKLTSLLISQYLPEEPLKDFPVIKHDINKADLPENFDARTQWPQCKSIQKIKDQSACSGSYVRGSLYVTRFK